MEKILIKDYIYCIPYLFTLECVQIGALPLGTSIAKFTSEAKCSPHWHEQSEVVIHLI